jgi:hypothetical protein
MLIAGREERAPKQARSHGNHLWKARRKAATLYRSVSPTLTAYGHAVQALWPWTVHEYPGIRAGMVKVLQGRAKPRTITHWMAGRRKAPQWAYQLLAAALERRIAEMQHALALIKKEAGD